MYIYICMASGLEFLGLGILGFELRGIGFGVWGSDGFRFRLWGLWGLSCLSPPVSRLTAYMMVRRCAF